jgi:hypothetical protein
MERCIDASKDILKKGCVNDMSSKHVDFLLNFGLTLQFKSKCFKDSKNQYCTKKNRDVFCSDCFPKEKELLEQLMANAPQEKKERALRGMKKRNKCGKRSNGDVKDKTNDLLSSKLGAASTTSVSLTLLLTAVAVLVSQNFLN